MEDWKGWAGSNCHHPITRICLEDKRDTAPLTKNLVFVNYGSTHAGSSYLLLLLHRNVGTLVGLAALY